VGPFLRDLNLLPGELLLIVLSMLLFVALLLDWV
jgi:hypothetical protein